MPALSLSAHSNSLTDFPILAFTLIHFPHCFFPPSSSQVNFPDVEKVEWLNKVLFTIVLFLVRVLSCAD